MYLVGALGARGLHGAVEALGAVDDVREEVGEVEVVVDVDGHAEDLQVLEVSSQGDQHLLEVHEPSSHHVLFLHCGVIQSFLSWSKEWWFDGYVASEKVQVELSRKAVPLLHSTAPLVLICSKIIYKNQRKRKTRCLMMQVMLSCTLNFLPNTLGQVGCTGITNRTIHTIIHSMLVSYLR